MNIPIHPLLVHIPVVLLPLTVLIALPAVFSRRWFQRTAPFLAGGAFLGSLGALLAASSGEDLLRTTEHSAILQQHAELGDATAAMSVVFLVVVAVFVALFWESSPLTTRKLGETKPQLYVPAAVIVAIFGIGILVLVTLTGHAGATSVWVS